MFVTVLVEAVPEPELPGLTLPPPAEVLLLDELELLRARLPITLNVTVKGSLAELLNFSSRAAEVSPADSMLSAPTLLL